MTMYYKSIYANTDKNKTRMRYDALTREHATRFCAPTHYFSSPGRCELVGNHTDHNCGQVLVASITQDVICAVNATDTNLINLVSEGKIWQIDLTHLGANQAEAGQTSALIRGVAEGLYKQGYKIGGFDCTAQSTLPYASGLSSSAAFELLICQVFNHLYNGGKIDVQVLAKTSQYAENVHFAKPCGLLDQFGVALGGVQKIDFADLANVKCEQCEMPALSKNVFLIKTEDDHSALTEYYAAIPRDMKKVANVFGKEVLSEVEGEFCDKEKTLPNTIEYNRARHFFAENRRVKEAFCALRRRDEEGFFDAINASGDSSRYLLANCALPNESDPPICRIIDTVRGLDGHCAIRVHGGGFRGGVLVFSSLDSTDERLNQMFGAHNIIDIQFRSVGACMVDYNKLF